MATERLLVDCVLRLFILGHQVVGRLSLEDDAEHVVVLALARAQEEPAIVKTGVLDKLC